MRQACVRYEVAGPVAWLVIDNAAHRNAMTNGMWSSVPDLVSRALKDPEVRVIALRGEGTTSFSAGADISEFGRNRTGEDAAKTYDQAVHAANTALLGAEKPTLAFIRGFCFGGAVELALTCDIRLATDDARFRIPAARLGLGYSYDGMALLASRLGALAAADLMFSARTIDAAEALRIGLVGQVFPVAQGEADAQSYIGSIAANAPLTLRAAKAALLELMRPEQAREPAKVARLVESCIRSADYREGQAAFREKRAPVFTGNER